MNREDTIAAIATPQGTGALGIIRISGRDAFDVADRLFRGSINPSGMPSHTIRYGQIVNGSDIIDNVMLSKMDSPNTYTGDDTVEITCHGGRFVMQRVLSATLNAGARIAEPGEFTARAFLNGKMDLTQAEAVQELISAENEFAVKIALRQMQGNLSSKLHELKSSLVNILAELEASIDFPEDDIETGTREKILNRFGDLKNSIDSIINTYRDGMRIRKGIRIAISGKPNVGKSSLFNALIENDRAIVTHLPGTTRDVIRESITWQGILLEVADTAGVRISDDIIEKEGVRRSSDSIRESEIILFVVDGSRPIDTDDIVVEKHLSEKTVIVVLNKSDLGLVITENPFPNLNATPVQIVSALRGTGISELKELILSVVWNDGMPADSGLIVTNERHKLALEKAGTAIQQAIESVNEGLSEDFTALHVREALRAIGEMTGEVATDEILDTIFSKFCIGK